MKTLSFAYPTSPDAVREGMAKTGCWIIEIASGPHDDKPIRVSYADRIDALQMLHKLPGTVGPYCITKRQEFWDGLRAACRAHGEGGR